MKALVLNDGQLTLDPSFARPAAPQGSVLVRVIQAGICETDLQLVAGYMGFAGIPGHEFVGVAESGKWAGQRVVGEINCNCHTCEYCQRGLGNHCPHRTVIGILNHHGAFAEYVVVPETNLHHVPDEITNDMATLVEPIAAALQIPEQVALVPDMRCYVLGDGRLGLLCAQVLKTAGCDVTAIGKHAEKLRGFADQQLATQLLQDARSLPQADVVVDCTGSESGLATAVAMTRPRGTVVMKTTVANQHTLSLAPLVIDELTLVGSRCGPFDKAIQALQRGEFQLDQFICGRYPLDDFEAALQHATAPDALKVILEVAAE